MVTFCEQDISIRIYRSRVGARTRQPPDAGALQSRPHGSQAQGSGIPLKRHQNGGGMTPTVTQIIGDWPLSKLLINMVGTTGFEPATSSVSRKRSNQLSYAPMLRQHSVYQEREGGGRCEAREDAFSANFEIHFLRK